MSVLDITADAYHADDVAEQPALSSTIANVLLNQSPLHAFHAHPKLNPLYEQKDEGKFDRGKLVHRLLLDGNAGRVEIIEADDFRTKAAKEQRDEARAAGKIAVLAKNWEGVQDIADAIALQIRDLNVTPAPLADGKPEQTLVWEDEGVTLKARLDWVTNDYAQVWDLKTTARSANPRSWGKTTLFGYGYDVQRSLYLRGVEAVFGVVAEWAWLVCETDPPYAVVPIALAPDAIAIADDKLDHAIRIWRDCLTTGEWPGYPKRLCYIDANPWSEANWLEQRDAEDAA